MYEKQRALTEKLLFDYYMISSKREDEIFSPFPFYLDKKDFNTMVWAGELLDKLVNRIILKVIEEREVPFEMGDFPFKNNIIALETPLLPFFWCRYDAFQREGGGVFFSEFNYDKPCAQRENITCTLMEPKNNPNIEFIPKFKAAFQKLCNEFYREKYNPETIEKKITTAILVSSYHYEETHLAHLYMDLLKEEGYEFIIACPENFQVVDEEVWVFDKKVDVVLRQYPTEFLHDIEEFDHMLKLFEEGKLLIINDPRAIIGQVKSLFAYLWELVNSNSEFATEEEKKAIRATIPYTVIFKEKWTEELMKNKDKYVIKAIYGRYSEEVYIGKMSSLEDWLKVIEFVRDSDKLHIIQEFCAIKKEVVYKFHEGRYRDFEAFCNFGIYLTLGEFTSICTRWSRDYLTEDNRVWISPIGIRDKSIEIIDFGGENRFDKWVSIKNEACFNYGYTGPYTNNREAFSLQGMVLDKAIYEELAEASTVMSEIIKKTTRFIQGNSKLICPILGIDEGLIEAVSCNFTNYLTFVGRLDWVIDSEGQLKLLEFNSETPAGLMEAIALNKIIKEKCNIPYINPNDKLKENIRESFKAIARDYERYVEIKNIGFVSGNYYEDWYNTTIILDSVKDLPYNFILGEISALEAKNDKLYLYNSPLDAIYRYYPLDWFSEDSYFDGVVDAFKNQTLSINPPDTFVNQSKAFFTVIWALLSQGFFTNREYEFIKKYVPKTALKAKALRSEDYCIKPFFGREGEEVTFSLNEPVLEDKNKYIFQERIDVQTINLDIYSTTSSSREVLYPIIGAYITGDSFAGIYTRAGGRVTDKWAVYLPTFIGE